MGTHLLAVAKAKLGTLLLASEMPVPIPRSRTVLSWRRDVHRVLPDATAVSKVGPDIGCSLVLFWYRHTLCFRARMLPGTSCLAGKSVQVQTLPTEQVEMNAV